MKKNSPKITFENNKYWNLKEKLKLSLFDQSGIKSYKIYYIIDDNKTILVDKSINSKQTSLMFEIPKFDLDINIQKKSKLLLRQWIIRFGIFFTR